MDEFLPASSLLYLTKKQLLQNRAVLASPVHSCKCCTSIGHHSIYVQLDNYDYFMIDGKRYETVEDIFFKWRPWYIKILMYYRNVKLR